LICTYRIYNNIVLILNRQRLRDAYERDIWDGARHTVAAIWDAHGWLWHGMYRGKQTKLIGLNDHMQFVFRQYNQFPVVHAVA
jgi:hypothetical protein